jgi:hypothetical protein
MSEEKTVKFKQLEAKRISENESVTFQLEDGAKVIIKVDIDRAGVALNYRNPDGSPHYNVAASLKVSIVSPERTYEIPKNQLPPSQSTRPGDKTHPTFIR